MKLRLRKPTDPNPETLEVDDALQLKDLNRWLAEKIGQSPDSFDCLIGHPPKRITPDIADKTVGEICKRGDILSIQPATAEVKRGHTDGKYIPPIEVRNSCFYKHDVPGDNSCLFHSVGWIFDKPAVELRQMVAQIVLSYPEKYTAAFLGSQPTAYAQWILQPSSWGGAIEIDLLGAVFQCEICVLDMTSKRPQRFGQGQGYTTRGFIVYTGNHYDAAGIGSSMDRAQPLQKMFSSSDERPFELADRFLKGEIKEKAK